MPRTLAPGPDLAAQTEVRASVFVTAMRRVPDAAAAIAFVEERRARHPDARHHCWAYSVGDDPAHRNDRSSDDGEPGGTAGIPMLQVLHHREVVNTAVVVSRWFGGVKLGAGGLVRAYSGAVSAALDGATLVERVRRSRVHAVIGHADAGRVEAELRGRGAHVLDVHHGAEVTLTLAGDEHALAGWVAALTSGTGRVEPAGSEWVDA